ncbi:sterol O-acyltransferase 1-like [Brevipalpus obovatus]|uniref:sterol O-acyltransferase 1-like n=1 Tax=Brevipalpus obovatus TaxID=246614 RepID=UPI003D9EF858
MMEKVDVNGNYRVSDDKDEQKYLKKKVRANSSSLFVPRSSILSLASLGSWQSKLIFHTFNLICLYDAVIVASNHWGDRKSFNYFWNHVFSAMAGTFTNGLLQFIFHHFWIVIQWNLINRIKNVSIFALLQIPLISILFYISTNLTIESSNGTLLRIAMTCETIRFTMKFWSLVAETYGKDEAERATLGELFYFLFAPTLIFRKVYPRTKRTSWLRVFGMISLVYLNMAFIGRLVINVTYPNMLLFVKEKKILSISTISMALVSPIVLMGIWLMHFHTWQNLWAEILRFADRDFYGPWWVSESNFKMIKEWNPIIHKFIKTYMFDSVSKKFVPTNIKFILVAIASGIGHDYIFSLAIKDVTLICTYTYFIPFAIAHKLIFKNLKYFTQFVLLVVLSFYKLHLFYRGTKSLTLYF